MQHGKGDIAFPPTSFSAASNSWSLKIIASLSDSIFCSRCHCTTHFPQQHQQRRSAVSQRADGKPEYLADGQPAFMRMSAIIPPSGASGCTTVTSRSMRSCRPCSCAGEARRPRMLRVDADVVIVSGGQIRSCRRNAVNPSKIADGQHAFPGQELVAIPASALSRPALTNSRWQPAGILNGIWDITQDDNATLSVDRAPAHRLQISRRLTDHRRKYRPSS